MCEHRGNATGTDTMRSPEDVDGLCADMKDLAPVSKARRGLYE